MRLLPLVFLTCGLLMPGCYSPMSFSSNSADILHRGLNPKYQIVFSEMAVRDASAFMYDFENPPPIEMCLHFIFLDQNDVAALEQVNAIAKYEIRDQSGALVLSDETPLRVPWRGPNASPLTVRPPIDWRNDAKGQVVRDVEYWHDVSDDADRKWRFSVPNSHDLPAGCAVLRKGQYFLKITIECDAPLNEPVHIYPTLVGGWLGSL